MGLVPKLVLFHKEWWKLASGEAYLKLWWKWIWLKMWGAFEPFIQLVDDVEILVGSYNGFIFYFQFFCIIIVNMLKIMHGWYNNSLINLHSYNSFVTMCSIQYKFCLIATQMKFIAPTWTYSQPSMKSYFSKTQMFTGAQVNMYFNMLINA